MLTLFPRVTSRRSLLLTGSALLLTASMQKLTSQAWAQEAQGQAVEQLRKDLDADRDIARGFYERLSNGERMEEGARKEIADTSFKLRVERASSLQAIFRTSPNPDATLAPLLYPDTAFLADEMRQQSVPTVPPPEDIKPDPTQSVPPPQTKPTPPEKWKVVLSILLETLGLLEIHELVEEILAKLDGYQAEQQKVTEAFRIGTPKQITDAVFGFLEWFTARQVCKRFLAELVIRKVSATVLRELSLRLVPWIGWAWLFVAFGLAVHRHWDELMT
jgi:hypothetical protein